MRKLILATLTAAVLIPMASAQQYRCDSIGASFTGGWKTVDSAPRDGTVVEMLQTYGVAPWYDLFGWKDGAWISATKPNRGVLETCLFWRPFSGDVSKYVDPTGGAQYTTKYQCDAMRLPYDKKKDVCKLPGR